jgi:hypothetical protein
MDTISVQMHWVIQSHIIHRRQKLFNLFNLFAERHPLQFGPQFGGMVNFKLRPASVKTFEYRGSHTYGAYNLVNTFNSFSGTIKNRFSYLFYYNYKRGDGWRDNSAFDQHNAFAQLKYYFNENMFLSVEYTYMNYLAQQAGGLTDAMFEANARQSIRKEIGLRLTGEFLLQITTGKYQTVLCLI